MRKPYTPQPFARKGATIHCIRCGKAWAKLVQDVYSGQRLEYTMFLKMDGSQPRYLEKLECECGGYVDAMRPRDAKP